VNRQRTQLNWLFSAAGGGTGLFTGCAAGDMGAALLLALE
jgi:hypothetical protein